MESIAVLMATRNTRELTLEALGSVFAGTGGIEPEVVVFDNGSTDGTEAAVRTAFPRVGVIRSERNLGFARAHNLAAEQTSAPWILLLNSDARLEPGALDTGLAYLRTHPDCAVLGAQLLNEDGSRQNSIANFPTLATELFNKSLLRRLRPERYPGKERPFDRPTPVESVIGAFFLTPRAVWRELGGLDERYFFFLEETDYCLRASRSGFTVVHHPGVRVRHRRGASAGQTAPGARIEYWRSRYRYFESHAGPWANRVLCTGLAVRLLVDWLANGLAAAATGGRVGSVRRRFRIYHALLGWHLRGCPAEAGLPR